MNSIVVHRRESSDWGRPKFSEKNQSLCHFFYHKSNTNQPRLENWTVFKIPVLPAQKADYVFWEENVAIVLSGNIAVDWENKGNILMHYVVNTKFV
jgi:hypothetical protein